MKLGVVGMGCAGLYTAACFAERFEVVGVEVEGRGVSQLRRGEAPIHERGLSTLLKKGLSKGSLAFSSDYDSLLGVSLIFVTVGTPSEPDGSIDLSQVASACELIARQLARSEGKPLVVIKSTVAPGPAEIHGKPLLESRSGGMCGMGFGLASNAEFLREGEAVEDTLHSDRTVIGPLDRSSGRALKAFYKKFYGPELCPVAESRRGCLEI